MSQGALFISSPSPGKLPGFFLRFQTEECVLRVDKSKITGENTSNGDHFEIVGNYESSKDEKTLFWVILQICYPRFNPFNAKEVYLRFSSIVWFLKFLSHFLWVLEAASKLTQILSKQNEIFGLYMYQRVLRVNVWLIMTFGHGPNPIFFNKKNKIGRPENLLAPIALRSIIYHFCLPVLLVRTLYSFGMFTIANISAIVGNILWNISTFQYRSDLAQAKRYCYLVQKSCIRLTSRVAKRLKTQDLTNIEKKLKISKMDGSTSQCPVFPTQIKLWY